MKTAEKGKQIEGKQSTRRKQPKRPVRAARVYRNRKKFRTKSRKQATAGSILVFLALCVLMLAQGRTAEGIGDNGQAAGAEQAQLNQVQLDKSSEKVIQEDEVSSQDESLPDETKVLDEISSDQQIEVNELIELTNIPAYTGDPYVVINGNIPFFTEEEKTSTVTFEQYSELDELGRCGVAYANVSRELQPEEERGEIGMIRPTGWVQRKYEGIVDSTPPYLYNRCHLIAYCLTGQNANEKNLITGTRYLNMKGMLPFEKKVATYLEQEDHHVLYRVTPIYEDNNLLASGVLMEGWSVEDQGEGIGFCVYCYNVQPGIEIDYATGESRSYE